jgi:uncharacterized protein YcfJ
MRAANRLVLALACMGVATIASAQSRFQDDGRGAGVAYDFARVVDAHPIYEDVGYAEPREVCWNEPVRHVYHEPAPRYRRHGSDTPEIVGGIIGGLVGNQFGSGSGRAAATVAGVALGASIARDAERDSRYYGGYDGYGRRYERTSYERRCELREDYRSERELVGYEVTWDYNGTIGQSFSRQHPGSEIRVRVAVEPADF